MSRNGKVIVAMSGGVDSSVAACLLKEQGYECVGVFMRVGGAAAGPETAPASVARASTLPQPLPGREGGGHHGCCSVEDALDARAVATRLGIPFYVLNFEADFQRIIDYFVDEYAHARTPNPCVLCNIHLKFGKLLQYADMLDAEFVATGHYARIVRGNVATRGNVGTGEGGNGGADAAGQTAHLARACNIAKDQSYVLFGIRREDLPRCLFPLGEMTDKAEVRRIAAELGLKVHDKPDSQEICFVPDRDYKPLVRARRPETQRPGPVLDADGREIGTHEGVANYTIGQRRGLRIATGQPIYVTELDAEKNVVRVGAQAALASSGLIAERMNWLTDPPADGEWGPVSIKIRHMHAAAAGRMRVVTTLPDVGAGHNTCSELSASGESDAAASRPTRPWHPADEATGHNPRSELSASGEADVAASRPTRPWHPDVIEAQFEEPQFAVTPGQAAVFYDADGIVLGGGWIARRVANSE